MGNQKLILLVRKHKKEKHILENVPIGKNNPKILKPQEPYPEEWDAADDSGVDNT